MKHPALFQSLVLADDDHDDHEFFREALYQIAPSVNLSIVGSGKDLMQLLRHYIPDFIFLDMYMPGKNGLECLQAIRANHMFDSTAIVIFSSTERKASIDAAYGMGADLFYVKPTSYKELLSSLEMILSLNWNDQPGIREQYFLRGKTASFA